MNRYEIYANGKLAPLTTVEAKHHYFQNDCLVFCNSTTTDIVAIFKWSNISGFKKVGRY